MTARLYFDEDAQRHALVEALRQRSLDVLTALEADMLEKIDQEQLAYAATQGRVLFSFNVADFCRLHGDWTAAGRDHAGIILARQQRLSIGDHMRRLLKLLAARSAEDMKNRLEFLSNWP